MQTLARFALKDAHFRLAWRNSSDRRLDSMLRCFLAFCLAVIAFPCLAADFKVDSWYANRYRITLSGTIKSGDEEVFRKIVLQELRAGHLIDSIKLYTPGGAVDAAMAIGEQVRLLALATISPVRKDGRAYCTRGSIDSEVAWGPNSGCECASACVIVWSAGVNRTGNYLGVHRFYFDADYTKTLTPQQLEQEYDRMIANAKSYFEKMEAPNWLIARLFSISSNNMDYLTNEEIKQFRNRFPWEEELILAKCGNNPSGSMYASEARKKWLDCYSQIREEVLSERARRYLARYGLPGEILPERMSTTTAGDLSRRLKDQIKTALEADEYRDEQEAEFQSMFDQARRTYQGSANRERAR